VRRRLLLSLCLVTVATPLAIGQAADERIQIAKARAQSTNNLKQVGLAFHMYGVKAGHLPNNVADAKGKLLLSWRVAILPYLEQGELYKEFKLDEPWDSDHNKKLIDKMPKIYAPARGKAEAGETYYRGFTGPGTIFEVGKKVRLQDIRDGTSNTVLVVEAEKAVPWTKPDDLPFDAKKELPKVGGSVFPDGFVCVFGDGSVRFVKKSIAADILKGLITRDGGEVTRLDG
jgi:hypothetical protein